MKTMKNMAYAFGFFLLLPSLAQAGIVQWQSFNLQLLRGHDYAVGSSKRTIVTFEYANQWTFGDFFMFVDGTIPDTGEAGLYGEISPRLSFSKISGKDMSFGIVKDIYFSTNFEKGKGTSVRRLFGGAIDLDLPGFVFFKLNYYIRNDPRLAGTTEQFTVAWKRPFTVGDVGGVFEGFGDFMGSEGTSSGHHLIVPRLLFNFGDLFLDETNRFWVGIEFQHWRNKFGINGVNEAVPQLQLKLEF